MRQRHYFLFILLLLAFGLRLNHLDVQSLWYDEGVTAQVAQLGVGELTRWTAGDIQPPLYYLLMNGWLRLFQPWPGNIAYLMRWLSVAWGMLLIPLLWGVARRLWNECTANLAALLATISPLLVYYSQEARMYTQLLTLTTMAAWAILHTLSGSVSKQRVSVRWWGLYGITALAALYTHYLAGFALVAFALYWAHVWWHRGHERQPLRRFLTVNALVVGGYLPWLPAMVRRFQVDASYWAGTLKLGEAVLDVAINFTVGATEVMLESEARTWLIGFAIITIAFLPLVYRQERRSKHYPAVLLLLWFFVPVLGILALAYRTPKFNPRYLMIAWPAWALFLAGGLGALWGDTRLEIRHFFVQKTQTLRSLLFISVLVFLLFSQVSGLVNWFSDANFAKTAWREAIAEMYFHRQADEAVLLVSGHAYPIFDTYVPPELAVPRFRLPEIEILDVNRVLGWEEVAAQLNRIAQEFGGVWLFLWQDEVIDPTHVTELLLDRYAQAEPVPSYAYIGLRHYRFIPGQTFPSHPPLLEKPLDFAQQLRLVGAEVRKDGLWLYWQALQAPLPDIQIALTVRTPSGDVLLTQAGRL
ncbi:MAG: hypothetical protein GXP38_01235 [Chloroflexi bacterium]|nr:hypothetical protein [Chloroflexota bacterium]